MTTITLTRHKVSSSQLYGLAGKEHRPWIRRRIKAIAMIRRGSISREAIARKLGTDSDQIRMWIQRYNARGLQGLEDVSGRGRKRTISPRQEAAPSKAMRHSPRKAGVTTNLWTGRAVLEYLTKRQWFSCSIPEAYVMIHGLGFTLQRPGRIPTKADPTAERRFLKELRGKKEQYPRAAFLAVDEAALLSIPTITRMWAVQGEQQNPQEMVRQILRRNVTHNTYYQTFKKEIAAARRFFRHARVEIKNAPASLIVRK